MVGDKFICSYRKLYWAAYGRLVLNTLQKEINLNAET